MDLAGSWKFTDPANGPLILSFKNNNTYQIDFNNDGQTDISGIYRLLGNRVRFTDDEPRVKTDCYESGFYYYTLKNSLLIFELFADQCKPRKFVLQQEWTQVE